MDRRGIAGFTLVELLVSLAVLSLSMTALASLMISNSRINKSQQMTAEMHTNAYSTLSMIVSRLRSAGWDPTSAGSPALVLDPEDVDSNDADGVNAIEIYRDLDADGTTDGEDEQMLIRHNVDRVEWRTTNDTSDPFVILAVNVSNDADGDGVAEPMFVADSVAAPTRLTVRITVESPVVDPVKKEILRYTVSSDVVFRRSL